jgi:hypothetical protein
MLLRPGLRTNFWLGGNFYWSEGNSYLSPTVKQLQVTLADASQHFSLDLSQNTDIDMGWIFESAYFVDQPAGPVTITLTGENAPVGSEVPKLGPVIATVTAFESVVPNGGITIGMLGTGMTGLAFLRLKLQR